MVRQLNNHQYPDESSSNKTIFETLKQKLIHQLLVEHSIVHFVDVGESSMMTGVAACVIKNLKIEGKVSTCIDIKYSLNPPLQKLNADKAEIGDLFENLGLSASDLTQFKRNCCQQLPNINLITILALESDARSSFQDALLKLYEKVSPHGYVLIYGCTASKCRETVLSIRSTLGIEEFMEVEGAVIFRKKKSGVIIANAEISSEALVSDSGPLRLLENESTGQDRRRLNESADAALFNILHKARLDLFLLSRSYPLVFSEDSYSVLFPTAQLFLDGSNPVSSNQNTGIIHHLPEIFVLCFSLNARSIVEINGATGWSTRALSSAARPLGARLLHIGAGAHCREISARNPAVFCTDRDVRPSTFADWAGRGGFQSTVDILFIDSDGTFEASRADLRAWEPHLAARAAVVLHGTGAGADGA